MSAPVIRNATAAEFETAVEWAAAEGWNPGLDDTPAFHAVDPDGFFMGFVDDRPVSSISVVRYGGAFGFLGFYIVHPDYRGTGAGLAIWRAGRWKGRLPFWPRHAFVRPPALSLRRMVDRRVTTCRR